MKKILIVDDSVIIYKLFEKIINDTPEFKKSVSISMANDGFEALVKIAQYKPDLIFMDYQMPLLNGFQTLYLIKQNKDFKNIPVIFLTAQYSIFDRTYGELLGADDYISKSNLHQDSFKNIVREYFDL